MIAFIIEIYHKFGCPGFDIRNSFHNIAGYEIFLPIPIGPTKVKSIVKFYKSLTQDEKDLFWKEFLTNNVPDVLFAIIDYITDEDIRSILVKGRHFEGWLSEKVYSSFSEFFYHRIISEILRSDKYFFPKAEINIKRIDLPDVEYFPAGRNLEFGKVNIFIGKNNQSKSRFLNYINTLINALKELRDRKYPYPYSVSDDPTSEILRKGFSLDIEITQYIRREDPISFWGWIFFIFEPKKMDLHIEFKNKDVKFEVLSHNFDEIPSEISVKNTLHNYIKKHFFKEDFSISNEEKRPDNGWYTFQETDAIKDFSKNIRSLIRYYEWLIEKKLRGSDYLNEIMYFFGSQYSGKEIRKHFRRLVRWKVINYIFKFHHSSLDGPFHNWSYFAPYRQQIQIGRMLLENNDLGFDITEDDDINRLKLVRRGAPKKGRDIAKQGHGIRRVVAVLLASLFGNFLLLDEPENGLHISLQEDLLKYLVNAHNVQTFIVTQSPSMIPHYRNCSVFVVDKGIIKRKELYPDKWVDHNNFIMKNLSQIRSILGVQPENMLFAKSILVFEGRMDVSFYADIFFEPRVLLHRADGVEKLKSTWYIYYKIMKENIMENIVFLFDRDYFNDIIANADEENAFTLPCYSFENLLFDPFFLNQILGVEETKIRELLLEQLDINEKTDTLNKLFIVNLFHSSEGIANEALDALKRQINWDDPDIKKLRDLLEGYWTLKENITKDDFDNSIKKINEISLNWDKKFIYFIEIKKKAKELLEKLRNKFLMGQKDDEDQKISVSGLKYRFIKFVKEKWDETNIPDSLFKDFINMCKKIRTKLNISLDIKRE